MFKDEWKLIYEQFYKPLYLYALSLTGNQQDAEDLLQDTFVKAYLSYENKGSIKYWLIVVLKNEFLQQQRKRKRETLNNEKDILIVALNSSIPITVGRTPLFLTNLSSEI